jgi:DNA repair/transcription protein MET18/MMS19
MDVSRIIRTQVTTGELAPPAELVTGECFHQGAAISAISVNNMNGAYRPGVNDGQVPLIDVVKGLGEYLTSTEDDTRLKGKTVYQLRRC